MKISKQRACIASVAMMLLVGSAHAAQVGKGKAKDDDQPGGGGAQAAVDAQGKLRAPTAEENAALLQQMARYTDQSAVGLTIKVMPGGMLMIDLQDRFQDVAIARLVDGKVDFACVDNAKDAKAFLESKASVRPAAPILRAAQPANIGLEEK